MSPLSAKQRSYLKSLAHSLKPIIQVGKEGVTDTVLSTLEGAFNTRELLKVKILESAPESAKESADQLAAGIPKGHLVQVIGRTVVLYRPHPDKPQIQLPR